METYAFQMMGLAHEARGGVLEDRMACELVSDRMLVAVMADGMGSCTHAARAAGVACEAGLWQLRSACPASSGSYGEALAVRASATAALSCAANGLRRVSEAEKIPLDDLGTTFMALVYDETERTLVYAYSGDGGILVLDASGHARLVVEPQAYGDSLTHDVLDSNWWRIGEECGVEAFLVCTDGLLKVMLDAQAGPGEASDLARLVLGSPGQRDYLDRLLSSRGEKGEPLVPTADVSDDRTLLACWSDALVARIKKSRAGAVGGYLMGGNDGWN